MPTGLFVTLEGGEGSGKSTQIRLIGDRLRRRNIPFKVVREPGGTPFGDLLRQVLKFSPTPLTSEAELLLFNASRAQLVAEAILPSLERGEVVLCDRFTDSTLAYQGYGRGIPLKLVEAVNMAATGDIKPRLTVLLDISPEEGLKRQTTAGERFEGRLQRQSDIPPSQIEQQGLLMDLPPDSASKDQLRHGKDWAMASGRIDLAFHDRVYQGYLALARQEPERWLIIDARLSSREVTRLIWQEVEPLLENIVLREKAP